MVEKLQGKEGHEKLNEFEKWRLDPKEKERKEGTSASWVKIVDALSMSRWLEPSL